MLSLQFERRALRAVQVFDLIDAFARDRGVQGPFPRPFGTLRFYLTGRQEGDTTESYDPPLKMIMTTNPSGYHLFFGQIETEHKRRINLITPESVLNENSMVGYTVRIESDYYQTEEVAFPAADDADGDRYVTAVALEPGLTYPFPTTTLGSTVLRGMAVDRETDQGLSVLRIKLYEVLAAEEPAPADEEDLLLFETTTNETGQWLKRVANEALPAAVRIQFLEQDQLLIEDEPTITRNKQTYFLLERLPAANGGAATYRLSTRPL